MNHNLTVTGSVDIHATPSKVWEALTNPSIIKKYLFGTETITDWKVGSEIIFQGEYEGKNYKDKGIVRENVQNELLSYNYWSGFSGEEDKPENYSLVTYRLSNNGPFTKLTWTNKGFVTEEGRQHNASGMEVFLKTIKDIIENK
jgi:uncharacterized protein YndB with AHSA1/START domain